MDFEPVHPGQLVGLHNLDAATTVVTGSAWLLENWPEHFNHLLQRIQDRRREMQSLRRSFGCLYRVLYVDLQAPGFQFLRDAFEKYLGENWWGFVCKRNRSLRNETVTTHPRLTLASAAQQAGTSLSMVRHLIEAKLLSVEEGVMPSGRRVRSVHRFDVPRISSLAHEALTLTEVAGLLALPENRVRLLVAAGLLTPLVSKRETHSATWLLPASQLEEYCSIVGSDRRDGVPVSLKQILKSWRLHDGEFAAVVNAIRERKLLPLSDRPTPLGCVALDAKTTRTWLRERRQTLEESVSIDQAARALRVKQEVAYGLVTRGFLCAMPAVAGQRRIRKTDLYAFMETFVSLAALARARGHSPRATLRMLQACPVSGPTVDGARQYFFRRADFRADELPPIDNLLGDQMDQTSKMMKGVSLGA
ncbi:helix-turn-helix domain-containing protein [Ralstonia holmesii]|uniref:helix-turn-helix domain-containing protein n=1 Tax=Ralstonia holmesii TaxID=3058602 RepID=UPI002930934F|nr:helix-turn-helix domain-containing protein [Ralstonia sp. LMG 32967]